ncbi:bleomycin resistance protein [Nitratireductor aestuarii]|uniref:Bleomycin resistance protein n=1 Tax=Nitratireductor aestuarii TaxID=1735103 RepID=A0A916RI29_9HYPH|nr:VOC family protein [Nitratireductor aestuarii]GGA57955.1 bleomycin resistance protein [Nitratireductor aestuarii]
MQPRAILESGLYVDDLDAAERFYRDVLGLEIILKAEGRHVFFRCGQGVLLLFNPDATSVPYEDAKLPVPTHGARGPGHLCFAASAEEIERWRTELEAKGVKIEADFEWPAGGRSIYVRDPAGNSIEFAEPRIWNL